MDFVRRRLRRAFRFKPAHHLQPGRCPLMMRIAVVSFRGAFRVPARATQRANAAARPIESGGVQTTEIESSSRMVPHRPRGNAEA